MNTLKMNGRKLLFLLGLSVTLMLLLPALAYDGVQYMGYEIIFGKELITINPFDLGTIASVRLPFSITALLAYTLPLITGIIALVFKKSLFITVPGFILSLLLLITLPEAIEVVYAVAGNESTLSVDWIMAYGLIASIVLSVSAIMLNGVLIMSENKKTVTNKNNKIVERCIA